MDLYLLRHGKAGQSPGGFDDNTRPLTAEGKKEIRNAGRFLKKRKIRFDGIATSPLLRARETAEIVAKVTGAKEDPAIWDELAPNGDPDTLCYQASQYGDDAVLLLVGHEPSLAGLISRVIAREGSASVALGKGGLAKIRHFSFEHSPSGELQWLLTSGLLSEME
ncbi:phosphohistidine phosphatase, SixA [Methanoregula boonei 6A8]|uniref:Phosphohistidine phosphatase, SixA n=1 Tax=Methanoregula boonei (strain DSM 21154 / JCM 14090 / 6A8) TaxID=456442 RepID=A7I516_METB6|nr:phosphohistidine phosphatase SixA [Methanoregula boonei]ABS54827.1 phosphohistidine phosphatase, SixA [Methanoregula boonei 6A8]